MSIQRRCRVRMIKNATKFENPMPIHVSIRIRLKLAGP
jgi:hypothetical protein